MSRVKGDTRDWTKVTALEAILSSRLGDRPLLFRASRDSLLSLVVFNVGRSLSFLAGGPGLETVIGIDLMLEGLQATSSPVQLTDETRLDSTQSSTPAKRHPGPRPIIRQSFNQLIAQSARRLHHCTPARVCERSSTRLRRGTAADRHSHIRLPHTVDRSVHHP